MSKLNEGNVYVELNGEEKTLTPTLKAITQISRMYNGLGIARDRVVAQDFDAIVVILKFGLNLSDKDAKDLPDVVWENGLTGELLLGLLKFLAILGNGGKPLALDVSANESTSEKN